MAIKVSYKQGTKATYLGLLERNPYALYFCTDTKELYRGDDLYSDGLRIVDHYDSLPAFSEAADGVIYFCVDSGCGYVLNVERTGWLPVIHGVDNQTIGINESSMMYVKAVPVESVTGLAEMLESIGKQIITGSDEISVSDEGSLSLVAVPQSKVTGLEDRLNEIEQVIVGGIHYRGAVNTFDELPDDAKCGDLYEVHEDNSEWCFNGEQWFEYGKSVHTENFATKDEVRTISEMVKYEISHKPLGTLVNYFDKEIRVMCSADTDWKLQESGDNADPNAYYIGFKAYAPDEAESFKEDLAEIISDPTMYDFHNDFAGIDEYGRKYSIVWLPVAVYDESSDTWTYYGANSNDKKCIGWYYSVEWFNSDGVKIASDTIRINLTNEDCHNSTVPYYIEELRTTVAAIEESYTWSDM